MKNHKTFHTIFSITLITSCFWAHTPIQAIEKIKDTNSNKQISLNYYTYQNQAAQWSKRYILDYDGDLLVYHKEIQLIANLIYLSFMRSYYTLQAQQEALKALDIIWRSWQNIAQTRLDPSRDTPYRLSLEEKNYSLSTFWELHDNHQKIGKSYAQAVQDITQGNFLLSINAKDSVINMRNQARTVVARSIVNAKNYIGELFYTNKAFLEDKANIKTKSLSFFSFLWDYIPKLAVTSFVEANKTNNIVSEKSWDVLMQIQEVGKKTWYIIEQERASFYFAFYKEIWRVIRAVGLDREYLNISFDQNGFLPAHPTDINNQAQFLPEPENLYNTPD